MKPVTCINCGRAAPALQFGPDRSLPDGWQRVAGGVLCLYCQIADRQPSGTIGESDAMLQLIRARLEQLEVTAYHVSVATGHRTGWLGDILRRGGSPRLVTIRQIADALGLTFIDVAAGKAPDPWPPAPAWLVAERAADVEDESLPLCGDCGRHRQVVARGMCAACYQRWRRGRNKK